jgi:hypothetical protein
MRETDRKKRHKEGKTEKKTSDGATKMESSTRSDGNQTRLLFESERSRASKKAQS